MNAIALREQHMREIGSVLSGNAKNQSRLFRHVSIGKLFSRTNRVRLTQYRLRHTACVRWIVMSSGRHNRRRDIRGGFCKIISDRCLPVAPRSITHRRRWPTHAARALPRPQLNPRRPLNAGQLINEGLRERQQVGTAAARSYFERAAQLEPNSHVPWFMLGNVASASWGSWMQPWPIMSTRAISAQATTSFKLQPGTGPATARIHRRGHRYELASGGLRSESFPPPGSVQATSWRCIVRIGPVPKRSPRSSMSGEGVSPWNTRRRRLPPYVLDAGPPERLRVGFCFADIFFGRTPLRIFLNSS